jgi:hypothetical protein
MDQFDLASDFITNLLQKNLRHPNYLKFNHFEL